MMRIHFKKSKTAALISASIFLTACGGGGESSGTNPPPTPNSAPTFTANNVPSSAIEAQEYSHTFTASDSDGDNLTFSISNKPAWASFDGTTGKLAGTPSYEDAGLFENIAITVSDGKSSTSTEPFSIEVANINRAPEITALIDQEVSETFGFSYQIIASDADQQNLDFTISGLPAWLNFDNNTQLFSGVPSLTDAGSSTVVINVTDGEAVSTSSFTIDVLNSVEVIGKVIDGYISGAEVYLDINNDGLRNNSEPFDSTDSQGDFTLVIKAEDIPTLQSSFLRAYLGSNASDASRPELNFAINPISLALSPAANLDASAETYSAFITPFSDKVATEFASLIDENSSAEQIKTALATAKVTVTSSILNVLGIDESHTQTEQIKTALFGDFIASPLDSQMRSDIIAQAELLTDLAIMMQDPTDTDEDGYSDLYEKFIGSDINNANSTPIDFDGDGFSNDEEIAAGTDINDATFTPDDLDGDGFSNTEEETAGSDINDSTKTPDDFDGDGFSNTEEIAAGTDVHDATFTPDDLDGDGVSNDADLFPKDPNEQLDMDGDQIGDNQDTDRDGNGILDTAENSLAVGRNFSCSIAQDKTVVCDSQSDNAMGQINVPAPLSNVTILRAGGAHACAVSSDDLTKVVCWGDNSFNQLDVNISTGKITDLVLGDNYTCTVASLPTGNIGSTVQCFGSLTNKEGDFEQKNGNFALVRGGPNHICANSTLSENGIDRGVPYCLTNDSNNMLTSASAGFGNSTLRIEDFALGQSFSCSKSSQDSITCAGDIVIDLVDGTKVMQAVAGDVHVCVLDKQDPLAGKVYCFGDNSFGQLNINSQLDNINVTRITATANTTCAYIENSMNKPICWGATTEFDTTVFSQNIAYVTGGDTFKCSTLTNGDKVCDGTIDGDLNNDGVTDLFDRSEFSESDIILTGFSICMDVKATDKLACLTTNGLVYPSVLIKGQSSQLSASAVVHQGLTGGALDGGICVLDNDEVNCIANTGVLGSETSYSTAKPTEMGVGQYTVCYIDDNGLTCDNAHPQQNSSLVDNMPDFSDAQAFEGLNVYQDVSQEYACVVVSYNNSQNKLYKKVQCWGSANYNQLKARSGSVTGGFDRFELTANNACLIQRSLIECWGDTANGIGSINTATTEQQDAGINSYNAINIEDVTVDDEIIAKSVVVKDVSVTATSLCYISASGLHCFGEQPTFSQLSSPSKIKKNGNETCVLDGTNVLVDDTAINGGTDLQCTNSDFGNITNIFDFGISNIATCVFTDNQTVCKSTETGYEFDGVVTAPQ